MFHVAKYNIWLIVPPFSHVSTIYCMITICWIEVCYCGKTCNILCVVQRWFEYWLVEEDYGIGPIQKWSLQDEIARWATTVASSEKLNYKKDHPVCIVLITDHIKRFIQYGWDSWRATRYGHAVAGSHRITAAKGDRGREMKLYHLGSW